MSAPAPATRLPTRVIPLEGVAVLGAPLERHLVPLLTEATLLLETQEQVLLAPVREVATATAILMRRRAWGAPAETAAPGRRKTGAEPGVTTVGPVRPPVGPDRPPIKVTR